MRRTMFVIAAIVASMTFIGGSLAHTPQTVDEYHSSDDGWWQTCKPTGAASWDPILYPGQYAAPGAHRHLFFGGRVRPETTTTALLRAQAASHCHWGNVRTLDNLKFDAANMTGYWVPDLWADDYDADSQMEWIGAIELHAYYKLGMRDGDQDVLRNAAHEMQPFPEDFKMIARDAGKADVGWYCSGKPETGGGANSPQFPNITQLMDAHGAGGCGDGYVVTADITFPQCGQYVEGTNNQVIRTGHMDSKHMAHVAYPTAAGCPATHPIVFPEVKYTIKYRAQKINGPALLSNGASSGEDCAGAGDLSCFHADYLMGWDGPSLQSVMNISTKRGENRNSDYQLCAAEGHTFFPWNGTKQSGAPIPNCSQEEPYYATEPNEDTPGP